MIKKSLMIGGVAFCCLVFCESWATVIPSASSQRMMQCQLSLKMVSPHLGKFAKDRRDQKYYGNLYHQTQDFLKKVESAPLNSLTEATLIQCQNLSEAIQCLMGHHVAIDGAALRKHSAQPEGQLTKQTSEVPLIELRRYRPGRDKLRYVYDRQLKAKQKQKKKEENEDEGLALISAPLQKINLKTKSNEFEDLE